MASTVRVCGSLLRSRRTFSRRLPYLSLASTASMEPLTNDSKCVPCEGIGSALNPEQVAERAKLIRGWTVSDNSKMISKSLTMKNFVAALDYVNRVGEIAEGQGHHPDLHITGYRNVRVDLFTHALGGLTDNDFIMAMAIDSTPAALKK